MKRLIERIKKLLFGKPYKGFLKIGDKVYILSAKKYAFITKIYSDSFWFFEFEYPGYDQEGSFKSYRLLSEVEKDKP